MKYNFDEVIDRSQNRSSKYDERVKKFGTADVIPLWVADMDFRTAQPRRESGDIPRGRTVTLRLFRSGR